MKKLLITICVLAATQFNTFAQDQKIGHINIEDLMLGMPERAAAEAKLKSFAETLDASLKAMGEEYQAKLAAAQTAKQEGTMTQTEEEFAIQELGELEERITKAQRSAQEKIAQQQEELLAPMLERAQAAIKSVAESNGFTYVLDSSAGLVVYFDKGIDIMDLVKAELAKAIPVPVGQ